MYEWLIAASALALAVLPVLFFLAWERLRAGVTLLRSAIVVRVGARAFAFVTVLIATKFRHEIVCTLTVCHAFEHISLNSERAVVAVRLVDTNLELLIVSNRHSLVVALDTYASTILVTGRVFLPVLSLVCAPTFIFGPLVIVRCSRHDEQAQKHFAVWWMV